ncbi:MAG: hypothetical protein HYV40_03335 [Candidatus Levybacteria bacterium]|nr:hypothetical protein [Candidatus Levybacteria bacterium]
MPKIETHPGESSVIEQTAKSLEQQVAGKVLVQFDRFGQAMRNTYSLKEFGFLVPDLAVCHYDTWYPDGEGAGTTQVFSRERLEKQRTKQSGTLYDLPFATQIRNFLSENPRLPLFKVWFSTSARQQLAQEFGAVVLSVSPEKRDYIEGKTNLPHILEAAGVDERCRLSSFSFPDASAVPSYEEIRGVFGDMLVIQGKSIGGDGTKIVRDRGELDEAKQTLTGAIKVTEYFPGYSSNTTVVTVPNDSGDCNVYVDLPSHKPTGIAEVGVHETLGAGNDWSQAFPEELLQQFVSSVEALGNYLYHEHGLVGIWGVDSIWSDMCVKINEINCRLQGTTEASAVNQILRGFPPFIALHLLSFLGGDTSFLPSQSAFNRETVQLASSDHPAPYYIKIKAKYDYPIKLTDVATKSGKYALENGVLVFVEEAVADTAAQLENSEVILADLPLPDSICHPDSELCTITGITEQTIFDDARHLSEIGAVLVDGVYNKFERYEGS